MNEKTIVARSKPAKSSTAADNDKTRIETAAANKAAKQAAAVAAAEAAAATADATIIVRPAKPKQRKDREKQPEKVKPSTAPASVASAQAATGEVDATVVIRPAKSDKRNEKDKALDKASSGRQDPQHAKLPPGTASSAKPAAEPRKQSSAPIVLLVGLAFLFIGLGSALTTVYLLSPTQQGSFEVADQDLNQELVSIPSDESEAEDERLIRAAIQPRILDLSGDPVIVRQLTNAPRQLLKLNQAPHLQAAKDLGIKNDVYRLRDVLDLPDAGLQPGILGSQDDIAVMQPTSPESTDTLAANEGSQDGTSIVLADGGGERFSEFADNINSNTKLGSRLVAMGLEADGSKAAEQAFDNLYQQASLKPGDKLAVRAMGEPGSQGVLKPVQISVYRQDALVGSIAINDIDEFAKSEDPWFQRDIFESPLLPVDVRPEDRPRLLDAIYAVALRNRIPAPVVGEMIMLLSRAQDLEQKVQPGDTITLIYSPAARNDKSGLGRIVFVSIGRTSGNLDCLPLQSKNAIGFECMSEAGESSVEADGMTMPVNGVIVAKFGPQGAGKDSGSDGGDNMNFGVDWTAPVGTPVVAAFAGDVTAVGQESGFGLVVRISHPDEKVTMYAYLQRVQSGIASGAKVAAGQVIGYIGTPPTSREPRLHFELRRAGVPVDPVSEVQATTGSGGAVDHFVHRIIYIESGNRCNARNPLSTAVGLGQFIESTWMTTVRLHRPDLLRGRSRQDVLNLRTECNLARAMTAAFTRDNAAVIRGSGHTATPGNLYLAHFLGVGGAVKVLRSDQNRQIAEVFGAHHVRANPFERGKSIGWLVSWAAKKMGGGVPKSAPKIGAPSQTATAQGDKPPAAGVKPGNGKLADAKAAATASAPAQPKADKPKSGSAKDVNAKDADGKKQEIPAEGATQAATSEAAPASDDGGPLAKSSGDPVLEKLKSAVLALLR